MAKTIFEWVLNIPQYLGEFSSWLTTPLQYINLSPLALLTIGGGTALITVIVIHIVRLFI